MRRTSDAAARDISADRQIEVVRQRGGVRPRGNVGRRSPASARPDRPRRNQASPRRIWFIVRESITIPASTCACPWVECPCLHGNVETMLLRVADHLHHVAARAWPKDGARRPRMKCPKSSPASAMDAASVTSSHHRAAGSSRPRPACASVASPVCRIESDDGNRCRPLQESAASNGRSVRHERWPSPAPRTSPRKSPRVQAAGIPITTVSDDAAEELRDHGSQNVPTRRIPRITIKMLAHDATVKRA